MTEQEFLLRIDGGRAFKEILEEGFIDLFRSMGWMGARSAMWTMFQGLVDHGDDERNPYMTDYDAAAALGAIEKALEGEDNAERKIEVIEQIVSQWEGK